MKTQILVIDDDEDGLATVCLDLEHAMKAHPDELPSPNIVPFDAGNKDADELLAQLAEHITQRWDAVLIDVTLTDRESGDLKGLLLPVTIARAVRAANRTAMIFLYSGIIQDYLRTVYELEIKRSDKRPVEQTLRTIIEAGVSEFLGRDKAAIMAVNRLLSAPVPLRLERELLKTPNLSIDVVSLAPTGIARTDNVMSFSAIAHEVRTGSRMGDTAIQAVIEQGVAAVANVFRLTATRDTPVLCITSECHDLEFLSKEISAVKEAMPRLQTAVIRSSETVSTLVSYLISKAVDFPVIVILLHGGNGYLKAADPTDSAMARDAPRWMNTGDHFALFRDKVVYCFSCNSITLAKQAIAAGAIAFVGFPDIPFYRFDDEEPRDEPELTRSLQDLFGKLTRKVLLRWFLGQDTIDQLVDVIRITVRGLTQQFEKDNPAHPYLNDVVVMFDKIAKGVDYEGDGNWLFPGP